MKHHSKIASLCLILLLSLSLPGNYLAEVHGKNIVPKTLIHRDVDYSGIGFKLMINEKVGFLKLNLPAKTVLKNLGEPDEKSKTTIWGADGLQHQTWFYHKKGIRLDLIRRNKDQLINSFTIEYPCRLKTTRNIGIGNTKNDVISKYQNEMDSAENDPASNRLIAGTVYGGIIFNFFKNKVSRIFVGAAAE